MNNKTLSPTKQKLFIEVLEARFKAHPERHKTILWETVENKLTNNPDKLRSLYLMEQTGGQPDVVGFNEKNNTFLFFDCSPESPNRRSLCYDKAAWESRKKHKPENNAVDVAANIGIKILSEQQYKFLQTLGTFDTKTSSWLKTPQNIRDLGGAIFGDFRYGTVFIYHNGVESYYAARGFRGCLSL